MSSPLPSCLTLSINLSGSSPT